MMLMPAHTVDFYRETDRMIHREEADQWDRFSAGLQPGGTIPVSEIHVGEAAYRLRRPVRGYFLRKGDGTCEFWADGFSPTFVGSGQRADDAYRDWRDRVHETFQDLYGKRPFEMSEDDGRRWSVLDEMIDVVGYRNETPVVVRQIGRVTQARPLPRQVTWVDGSKDSVNFNVMPAEFAGYKAGQYFEADVERDPLNWRLRRVRHVQRIKSVPPMTTAAADGFWESLAGTASLPETSRDWTEP